VQHRRMHVSNVCAYVCRVAKAVCKKITQKEAGSGFFFMKHRRMHHETLQRHIYHIIYLCSILLFFYSILLFKNATRSRGGI